MNAEYSNEQYNGSVQPLRRNLTDFFYIIASRLGKSSLLFATMILFVAVFSFSNLVIPKPVEIQHARLEPVQASLATGATASAEPRQMETNVFRANGAGKYTVPITLVIPCNGEDFETLPVVLSSVANQTVYPAETIIIANIPDWGSDGMRLIDNSDHPVNMSWLDALPRNVINLSNREPTSGRKMLVETKSKWSSPLRFLKSVVSRDGQNIVGSAEKEEESVAIYGRPPVLREEDAKNGIRQRVPFSEGKLGLDYALSVLPGTKESLEAIPNFKLFLRTGKHWAGNNRMYGVNKSAESSEIVSLFDCDDYMHPQRIEYLWRAFSEQPDLEALIHSYYVVKYKSWKTSMPDFLRYQKYPDPTFFISYEDLWAKLPQKKLPANETEPNLPGGKYIWFYPKDMGIRGVVGRSVVGHNGWLTAKKSVFSRIPYPDTSRGQDSLYNWRLLKNKVKWNVLSLRLAAYMRVR